MVSEVIKLLLSARVKIIPGRNLAVRMESQGIYRGSALFKVRVT